MRLQSGVRSEMMRPVSISLKAATMRSAVWRSLVCMVNCVVRTYGKTRRGAGELSVAFSRMVADEATDGHTHWSLD